LCLWFAEASEKTGRKERGEKSMSIRLGLSRSLLSHIVLFSASSYALFIGRKEENGKVAELLYYDFL